MVDIDRLMKEIADASLERSIKIASLALVSYTGKVIYQTRNWDLSKQTKTILGVAKGNKEFEILNTSFSVVRTDSTKTIGVNKSGMGAMLILTYKGGLLVSYILPGASPEGALNFLEQYVGRLNEIK